jgi:hypothetical protein
MAKQALQTLKSWFIRGAKPTAQQFSDVFDSFVHKDDAISQQKVENLGSTLTQMQADIDTAVKIADPSKYMGVSGIASQANQMWCRIARIKIELPSANNYSEYQETCTFVGSIDVMSQCTNPYAFQSHYIQSGRLLLKVSWSHPHRNIEVELKLVDAVSLTPEQIKVIEITHDADERVEELDVWIRTSYMHDRFFYFYKTNVQYSDVLSFTAIEAESPVYEGDLPSGVSFTPTDGTEDKSLVVDFTSQTTVSISHTLNKYPSVTIVDENGCQILADVCYNSRSSITVTFSEPMSGSIYFN